MRRTGLSLVLLALAACGGEGPIPEAAPSVRLEADAEEVRPGEGFEVRVVRTWPKGREPEALDPAALAPLTARAIGVLRREDATRVRESIRLRAHAFSLADVRVAAPALVVPASGDLPEQRVGGTGLRVRVRPQVDPERPGPPEVPDPLPLRAPSTRWGPPAAWAAGLLLLGLVFLRLRRAAARPPARPGAPGSATARERVAALRAGLLDEAAAAAAIAEAASLVRAEVERRFGIPAARRTSEETRVALEQAHGAGSESLAALVRLLGLADTLKYARGRASRALAEDALRDAETFLEPGAGGRP